MKKDLQNEIAKNLVSKIKSFYEKQKEGDVSKANNLKYELHLERDEAVLTSAIKYEYLEKRLRKLEKIIGTVLLKNMAILPIIKKGTTRKRRFGWLALKNG